MRERAWAAFTLRTLARLLVPADSARARGLNTRTGFGERRRLLLPRPDGVLVEFSEMERAAAR